MNWNQKFGPLAIVFSLLAVTCQLCADADYSTDAKIRNLESRVNAMEYRRGACMVNPPARPTQKCDWGGYITVDALLLKPQENGMDFVVRTQDVGQTTSFIIGDNSPFLSGRSVIKSLKFKWDWGFRLGLGANLPHDAWDVYLNWTRFRTHSTRHVVAPAGQLLTPTFVSNQMGFLTPTPPAALTSFALTDAKSKWKLHLNELDFEVGRAFFVSKWLVLKPHAGLATAWIRQKDRIAYNNWFPGSDVVIDDNITNAIVRMKNNYWGIGIRGGLDTQWGIGCGWSLFGNFAASLLYGYFNVQHDEFFTYESGLQLSFFGANNFFHVDRLITDFMVGLRYDYMFCDEAYHLGFQIGWEHHGFWGQNQFPRFVAAGMPGVSIANQGDLTLQGFSAEVRFDF